MNEPETNTMEVKAENFFRWNVMRVSQNVI